MNLGLRTWVGPEAFEDAGTSLATSMLRCRTISLRASRGPAVFRTGRELAVFLPDVLTDLPSACRTAAPLAAMFDVTVCELPGHGASGEVADLSLTGFAQEYAALIDSHVPACRGMTLIGEGFAGLLALETARLRPERVARVVLLDTPFLLTRPAVASALAARWRSAPSPYARLVLREMFGVDPNSGASLHRTSLCDMVEDVDFACAVIAGSETFAAGAPSMLTDADLDALHAANGALLIPARMDTAGHAVLDDDPAGCMLTLTRLLAAA